MRLPIISKAFGYAAKIKRTNEKVKKIEKPEKQRSDQTDVLKKNTKGNFHIIA